MVENDAKKSITINGLIVPAQWDKEGNVKGIALAGFDEINYSIRMDKMGKSLLELLHKKVTVSGDITKIDNSKRINVKKFELKKSP